VVEERGRAEMKAVERAKLVRSLRHESRRLRLLVLVIGFFLVTLTFVVVVSKPDALLFNRTRWAVQAHCHLFTLLGSLGIYGHTVLMDESHFSERQAVGGPGAAFALDPPAG
jgi:hypothetical protein